MSTTSLTGNNIPADKAEFLCEFYRAAMFDDVVPWWMEHSLDQECGGYYSLIERDGSLWGTDKYMWMNGRQLWMLSHLYNTVEQKTEWLDAARLGYDFMIKHAFADDGKMHFRLEREGKSRSEVLSRYTEVFGAIGMAEYARASGDKAAWEKALAMYDFLIPRLNEPSNTPLLGYPTHQEFQLHSPEMCRMTVAWVYNQIRPDLCYEDDLTKTVDNILTFHWKPELGALLENVATDGSAMLDLPEGRLCMPGHAVESAWMLMEIARERDDTDLLNSAIDITLASLEFGWDQEYGGLRYLRNIDSTPCHLLEGDMKLWWPHSETLYALLLGWDLTGREDLARWYEKVHEYTFANFPDPEHGEWFGYLNRDGSKVWTAKANGWKGMFHLPRILLRCYQMLE